jgi:hypothetical protein
MVCLNIIFTGSKYNFFPTTLPRGLEVCHDSTQIILMPTLHGECGLSSMGRYTCQLIAILMVSLSQGSMELPALFIFNLIHLQLVATKVPSIWTLLFWTNYNFIILLWRVGALDLKFIYKYLYFFLEIRLEQIWVFKTHHHEAQ